MIFGRLGSPLGLENLVVSFVFKAFRENSLFSNDVVYVVLMFVIVSNGSHLTSRIRCEIQCIQPADLFGGPNV